MHKGLSRWKLAGKPGNKLLIKAFDHWKKRNALRKIMKHWLNFSSNKVQWAKADMQEAFNRWRYGDLKAKVDLDR